jgi:hypothetical protein
MRRAGRGRPSCRKPGSPVTLRHLPLVALALQGCAALPGGDWHESPSHPPLRAYHLVVSDAQMQAACGVHPGLHVFGCAVRLASEGVCVIYTRRDPPAWLLTHEHKHCDGWDHAAVERV